MKNEKAKFLKNPKTGVVFQQTRVLSKMRADLIPCTRAGISLAHANVGMPSLYNPFTNVIVPNSGENSLIPGLIPCRDREHADEIKASLAGLGGNPEKETADEGPVGLKAPEVPKPTDLDDVNVDEMSKSELKEFAMKHFAVKINGQKGEDTLREEVQTLINEKLEAA